MLLVETPTLLENAQSVFLSCDGDLGIKVYADPQTGRACIAQLAAHRQVEPSEFGLPGSPIGRDKLAPGDLIVAISEGGTLHNVANSKEATARLKADQTGTVELRIVRPSSSDSEAWSPRATVSMPMSPASNAPRTYESPRAILSTPPAYTYESPRAMFSTPPAYSHPSMLCVGNSPSR